MATSMLVCTAVYAGIALRFAARRLAGLRPATD
jgi:hypothetical protein